jgi:hypothetical protein
MTSLELSRRVARVEDDLTAISDTVLDIKETVDRHTETLATHGWMLAEHGRMLAEHTETLAEHTETLAKHGHELAAIRKTRHSTARCSPRFCAAWTPADTGTLIYMSAAGLPELDVARVQCWCAGRVPERARHQLRATATWRFGT